MGRARAFIVIARSYHVCALPAAYCKSAFTRCCRTPTAGCKAALCAYWWGMAKCVQRRLESSRLVAGMAVLLGYERPSLGTTDFGWMMSSKRVCVWALKGVAEVLAKHLRVVATKGWQQRAHTWPRQQQHLGCTETRARVCAADVGCTQVVVLGWGAERLQTDSIEGNRCPNNSTSYHGQIEGGRASCALERLFSRLSRTPQRSSEPSSDHRSATQPRQPRQRHHVVPLGVAVSRTVNQSH
jgi:hypothetical protein